MLGNMILPGIGGLLASGLYTKAQGGSWGDALKAAGMAYLGNVASAGIMGGINAPSGQFFDGFSKGIGQGITAPIDAVSGLIQGGSASPFSQGIFGENTVPGMLKEYDPKYLEGAAPAAPAPPVFPESSPGARPSANLVKPNVVGEIPSYKEMANLKGSEFLDALKKQNLYEGSLAENLQLKYPMLPDETITDLVQGRNLSNYRYAADRNFLKGVTTDVGSDFPGTNVDYRVGLNQSYGGRAPFAATADDVLNLKETGSIIDDRNFLEKYIYDPGKREGVIESYLSPNRQSAQGDAGEIYREKLAKYAADRPGDAITKELKDSFYKKALAESQPNFVKQYAPLAGVAALGAYAGGAFDEEPPPPPNATQRQMAAYDAYLAARARGGLSTEQHLQMRSAAGIVPQYTRSQLARIIGRDVGNLPDYYFARGRAGGGEVMGPGTGTSDSIPARLSDGEFVMTARAVENAGGGNRSLGAARMYDMMNRFEQGAA
jgi:hypothetical protein